MVNLFEYAGVKHAVVVSLEQVVNIDRCRYRTVRHDSLFDALNAGYFLLTSDIRPRVDPVVMVVTILRTIARCVTMDVREIGLQHGAGLAALVRFRLMVPVGEPTAVAPPFAFA